MTEPEARGIGRLTAAGCTTMIIYEPLLVTLAQQRQEGPDDAT